MTRARALGAVRLAFLLGICGFSLGCSEIADYSTQDGESYCGKIVQAPIVRRGFAETVQMRMTLDANRLANSPGTLTTNDGLFKSAPLRPIPEFSNDPLFDLNFGEGRNRNMIYAVDPSDSAQGPTVTVVL